MNIQKNVLILKIMKIVEKLYNKAKKFSSWWYESIIINTVRRKVDYFIIKIKYKFINRSIKSNNLKLHLGCGNQKIKGHINIDFRKFRKYFVFYLFSHNYLY